MPASGQQDVGKLVKQREDPTVGSIRRIQKDHRQWSVWNAGAAYLSQFNIPGLKNQNALPLNGCTPSIQCRIRSRPAKLGFPRDAECLADAVAYDFLVLVWMCRDLAFGDCLAQAFVKFAGGFAAKHSSAESQPQRWGFGLGSNAWQATEFTLRIEAVRRFREEEHSQGALVNLAKLSELDDGRTLGALLPLLESLNFNVQLRGSILKARKASSLPRPNEQAWLD